MTPAKIQQIMDAVKSSHRTTVKAMGTTYSTQLTDEESGIIVAGLAMLLTGAAAAKVEEREACAQLCDVICSQYIAIGSPEVAAAVDDVSIAIRERK